jgi:pimeloyl-ACP methyl ester carboxylesterase
MRNRPVTATPAEIWQTTTGAVGALHVVLVHGSLDRSAGLLKLSRRLDSRFRVTRYDRRGYGRSRHCGGPFDMERQVADLLDVISRAESASGRCVVVGHSYGGNVALAAAQRDPRTVAGVVAYESPWSWEPWWRGGGAGADALAWRHDPAEAAERFMRNLIGDARWERLPPTSRAARRDEGEAMIGEMVDLSERAPWVPELIGVPVLALHGEHGADRHRRGSESLAEQIDDAVVTAVPGARHFGPNTHPDIVAGLVADFIDRLAAR